MRQSGMVAVTVSLLVSLACHETSRTVPTAPSVVGGPGLLQTTFVQAFAAAGSIGGGVLVPGTRFPSTGGSSATLLRGASCLEYTIDTTGLPPGAYTNWVFTFDKRHAEIRRPAQSVLEARISSAIQQLTRARFMALAV